MRLTVCILSVYLLRLPPDPSTYSTRFFSSWSSIALIWSGSDRAPSRIVFADVAVASSPSTASSNNWASDFPPFGGTNVEVTRSSGDSINCESPWSSGELLDAGGEGCGRLAAFAISATVSEGNDVKCRLKVSVVDFVKPLSSVHVQFTVKYCFPLTCFAAFDVA